MRVLVLLMAIVPCMVAQNGEAVYRRYCAICHDRPGERTPGRASISQQSVAAIVRSLKTGTMRTQGQALEENQIQAVAGFLSLAGKQVEQDSPQARCAGEGGPWSRSAPEWNGWGVDDANTRFQPAPGLTAAEVPKLRLKWAFGFAGENVARAQPAISGGRVFVGHPAGKVYALDLQSGCIHWTTELGAPMRTAVVLGPDKTAFVGDMHGRVHAIDAEGGRLLWTTAVETHPAARITAAPKLHDGVLYVPVSSGEEPAAANPNYQCCTFRGSLVAVEANSGRVLWKRWLIDREAKRTGVNRTGTPSFGPSGVAVWASPAVDARRGLIYAVTGDNYSHPATDLSDAVLAVEMKTGRIVWSQQMMKGDIWNVSCIQNKANCPDDAGPDYDFGASPILVELRGGRRVLLAGQKSGLVYALDPDRRGRLLWQARAAEGGFLGGVQWGMATDGELVYAPASDVKLRTDTADRMLDSTAGGGLTAIRISDGREVWKARPAAVCKGREGCSPAQSAPATAMPGIVFSPSLDGHIRAYRAADGMVVWDYDTVREFDAVNGVTTRGGSIDAAGVVVAGGVVLVNSGYPTLGGMSGNALLAFTAEPPDGQESAGRAAGR